MTMRKLIILTILLVVFTCAYAFTAEPADTETESDWTYLTHAVVGIAWKPDKATEHTFVSVSVVTWKDAINLDLGLLDADDLDINDGIAWTELSPVIGISANIDELGKLIPQLQPIIARIPAWMTVGGGFYIDLDNVDRLAEFDFDDFNGVFYVGLSWKW